jgi:hypothetical protein
VLSTLKNQTAHSDRLEIYNLFRISYLWYSLIAVVIVFFVGILTSYLTGFTQVKELNENLYINIFKIQKSKKKVRL